jgi:hypothetical protein
MMMTIAYDNPRGLSFAPLVLTATTTRSTQARFLGLLLPNATPPETGGFPLDHRCTVEKSSGL